MMEIRILVFGLIGFAISMILMSVYYTQKLEKAYQIVTKSKERK